MLTSSLDDNDLCMLIAAPLTPSLIPRLKNFLLISSMLNELNKVRYAVSAISLVSSPVIDDSLLKADKRSLPV